MLKKIVYIFIVSIILVPVYALNSDSDSEEEKVRESIILDFNSDSQEKKEREKENLEDMSLDSDSESEEDEPMSYEDMVEFLDSLTEQEKEELIEKSDLTEAEKEEARKKIFREKKEKVELNPVFNTMLTGIIESLDDPNLSNDEKLQEVDNAISMLYDLILKYPEKSPEIRQLAGTLYMKLWPLNFDQRLRGTARHLGPQIQHLRDYLVQVQRRLF